MSNLTPRQRDMLFRIALAEKHTSPSTPSGLSMSERMSVVYALMKRGLVTSRETAGPGPRLTERGRAVLLIVCKHAGTISTFGANKGTCIACGKLAP